MTGENAIDAMSREAVAAWEGYRPPTLEPRADYLTVFTRHAFMAGFLAARGAHHGEALQNRVAEVLAEYIEPIVPNEPVDL